MHAVDVGEGVIGRAWQSRQAFFLADVTEAPELAKLSGTTMGATSVMVTPLLYGKQNMGVLALGNGRSFQLERIDYVYHSPRRKGHRNRREIRLERDREGKASSAVGRRAC